MLNCLRSIRINHGYTIEEVAEKLNLSVEDVEAYEKDSGDVPISIGAKICRLFKIGFEDIHWGTETECIEHNRKNAQTVK